MEEADSRATALGLEQDELAFYDAIAANHDGMYEVEFLRGLVHDVVQSVKRNLKVDWTEPHREDIKAGIRAAVKRILRTRGVTAEDLEPLVAVVMTQAEALYGDWPRAT